MLQTTEDTRHDRLVGIFANLLRNDGYEVRREQRAGSKRVDLYARKDSLHFTLEVVDTHYSGPLSEQDFGQLIVQFAEALEPQHSHMVRVNVTITDEQDDWVRVNHINLSRLVQDKLKEEMAKKRQE